MNSLSSLRNHTESKINNASALLQRIQHLVGSIPFALHIENDSSIMLVPTSSSIESPHTSEISVDIKTYSREGMLLFMAADHHNLTSGSAGETVSTVSFPLLMNQNVWYCSDTFCKRLQRPIIRGSGIGILLVSSPRLKKCSDGDL